MKKLLLGLLLIVPLYSNIFIVDVVEEKHQDDRNLLQHVSQYGQEKAGIVVLDSLPKGKHEGCYRLDAKNRPLFYGMVSQSLNYQFKYADFRYFFYVEDEILYCIIESKPVEELSGLVDGGVRIATPKDTQITTLGEFDPNVNYWVKIKVYKDRSIEICQH